MAAAASQDVLALSRLWSRPISRATTILRKNLHFDLKQANMSIVTHSLKVASHASQTESSLTSTQFD